MAGFFDNLFGDDDTTSFFGGYRPRPAASPADPTGMLLPISDTTPAGAAPTATGTAPDVLAYPDSTAVVDINTGQPYPRPDRLNMQDNIATGTLIKQAIETPGGGDIANPDLMFAPLFVHGSEMDYQRPLGHPFGQFDKRFKNISNYNFGVVGAATGYDLEKLLNGAALYAKYNGTSSNETPYGLTNEQMNNIVQGFSDYANGLWSPKESGSANGRDNAK